MPAQLTKRWQVTPRAPADHFKRFTDLPALVVQILHNRGITEPEAIVAFLEHRWDGDDPMRLKGMAQAVERLDRAIHEQEPIAIYGDYDADGVTATALLMHLFTSLEAQVQPYIPNRFDEGYGLNSEALTELAGRGVRVVVTVDCGIRAVREIAHGNSLGLDIIVTDHHHIGERTPAALAAINPRQQDCPYPFKELAGVGLAYKLAQALLRRYNPDLLTEDDLLDLVAVGTVADLAPLYGENRSLVARGLARLNRSLRPGLAALLARTGPKSSEISTGTIGFVIGPRLNAAGRLDSALAAYHLLMARNELEAIHLADQLHLQNQERQKLTQDMFELARQMILVDGAQEPLYFVSHPDFNRGVVGLAASRLVEEFYRPTLVAEQGKEETKGSARSIPEFHITEALDRCEELLVRYGGHAAAAGFTVKNENLPALQARLQKIAREQLDLSSLQPTLTVDAEINLRGMKPALIEQILALQPFGISNPTPRFLTRGVRVQYSKAVGREEGHLRLMLNDGRQNWSAIAFRQGHWAERLKGSEEIDIVYHLEFNEWNGERWPQLNILDLRLSAAS